MDCKFIKQNKDLGLFSDVLFSPISIWNLAEEIKFLMKLIILIVKHYTYRRTLFEV